MARFVPDATYQAAHPDTFIGMHAAFSRLATVQQRARYFSVWLGGTLSCALASACIVSPFHPASYVARLLEQP
jgi:hypothetical protein